jgi:phosphopantothenoylcysteine decarboxylase/phosphopantothenate--cysteine ligase
VRGITNLSSGKMGFAIARAAREAGAEVTLVAGPVFAHAAWRARIDVQSRRATCWPVTWRRTHADVFIATAAVADWRPARHADQKIKKDGSGQTPATELCREPGHPGHGGAFRARKPWRPEALYCVGFAAESHDLLANARPSALRKGVPLLVGNIGPATFGKDDNALLLVDAEGVTRRCAGLRHPGQCRAGPARLPGREPLTLAPNAWQLVPTGMAIHLADPGYAAHDPAALGAGATNTASCWATWWA